MLITRKINEWIDKKDEENDGDYSALGYAKTAGLGMLEGLVDGCFIVGAAVYIGTSIKIIKALINCKKG